MVDEISHEDTQEDGFLVRKHYLKKGILNPTPGCRYSGAWLTGEGTIECTVHGTVESVPPPPPPLAEKMPERPVQAEMPPKKKDP